MKKIQICPRYYIECKNPFAILAVLFMTVSAGCRIFYYANTGMTPVEFWLYDVNMLAAAVIFDIAILVFGKTLPQLTTLPVCMGVIFFAVKSFTFESTVHTALCLILYTGVLVLYTLTIFGVITTKILLYPLFGLPLLYHIFVEDMQLYFLASTKFSFYDFLPELSVLCIMAALFCLSFSLKKSSASYPHDGL